jgi:hypothetical protein
MDRRLTADIVEIYNNYRVKIKVELFRNGSMTPSGSASNMKFKPMDTGDPDVIEVPIGVARPNHCT